MSGTQGAGIDFVRAASDAGKRPAVLDRFAYHRNLAYATGYRAWRGAFWPPSDDYRVFCLDLVPSAPALGATFTQELESLRELVESAWHECAARPEAGKRHMPHAEAIARNLRRIAGLLPDMADRQALDFRATAVERGYDDSALSALTTIDEDIAFVAGNLSSWYGKHVARLPTAFGCQRHGAGSTAVATAVAHLDEVADYIRLLHAHLRLSPVPAFAAMQLFFMAGEGDRHPKHIAYFLPENEGVKYSPFKKTYYFVNSHRALVDSISLPLAARFLDLGRPVPSSAAEFEPIPTLGVLAHEMGHFVHREGTTFAGLNAVDRWASITLQEIAADVFGMLAVAEVFCPVFRCEPADMVMYHLAECLRYVDRGLGFFPDSDGMLLQLNYLVRFGALRLDARTMRLVGTPAGVLAAFRSLARVLADTLLAADVERTMALYRVYGPETSESLAPLLGALREAPQKTIEYVQESAPGRLGKQR